MAEPKEKIVLGIDPGTQIWGFGVVHLSVRRCTYVDMGVVKLKNEKDHFVTLKKITKEVAALIEKHKPDEMAIEAPFYGKNAQVMLKLGRAQGAAISAALMRDIPIFEYSPRTVKLAVTGSGAASKEQVAVLVQRLLGIDMPQEYADATDALAISLCHCYNREAPDGTYSKNSSWESFVKNNPQKIIK